MSIVGRLKYQSEELKTLLSLLRKVKTEEETRKEL